MDVQLLEDLGGHLFGESRVQEFLESGVFSAGAVGFLPIAEFGSPGTLATNGELLVFLRGEDRTIVTSDIEQMAPCLAIIVHAYNGDRVDAFTALDQSRWLAARTPEDAERVRRTVCWSRRSTLGPLLPGAPKDHYEVWEGLGLAHPYLGIHDDLDELSPDETLAELDRRVRDHPEVFELSAVRQAHLGKVYERFDVAEAVTLLKQEVRESGPFMTSCRRFIWPGLTDHASVEASVGLNGGSFAGTEFEPIDGDLDVYSGKYDRAFEVLEAVASNLPPLEQCATLRNAAWLGCLQRQTMPTSTADLLHRATVEVVPEGFEPLLSDRYRRWCAAGGH